MRMSFAFAFLLIASPAVAQVSNPPDPSGYATATDLSTLQANLMAAMPQPASTVPPSELVGGQAGAATTYRRSDARDPRLTRAGSCITDAAGTCSVTWGTALPATNPNIIAEVQSSTQYFCQPTTAATTTAATIKCGSPAVNLLTLAILTSGTQNLGGTTPAPAGLTVQVTALPRTEP